METSSNRVVESSQMRFQLPDNPNKHPRIVASLTHQAACRYEEQYLFHSGLIKAPLRETLLVAI